MPVTCELVEMVREGTGVATMPVTCELDEMVRDGTDVAAAMQAACGANLVLHAAGASPAITEVVAATATRPGEYGRLNVSPDAAPLALGLPDAHLTAAVVEKAPSRGDDLKFTSAAIESIMVPSVGDEVDIAIVRSCSFSCAV
jgi:hypothetical protein